MNIKIETERLILREFELTDIEAVYEFNSNEEVQRYTGDTILESREHAKKIITDVWFEDYMRYGYGRWAVIYKPDNRLIGFAGLKFLPEFNETDIGYRILPDYWRRGIVSEASVEIIKYGFEKLNLERIIGIASVENIGSWKILEKIGLTFYQKSGYDGSHEQYNWYKLEKKDYFHRNNI